MSVTLHYATDLYVPGEERDIFPLLLPYTLEPTRQNPRRLLGGASEIHDGFALAPSESDADVAILPMSWTLYARLGRLDEAYRWVMSRNERGLPTWTWISGDFSLKLPDISPAVVFTAHGHRSRAPRNYAGLPAFIADPREIYFPTERIAPVASSPRPSVAFCGHAAGGPSKYVKEVARTWCRNTASRLGLDRRGPDCLTSPTWRRQRILERLESNREVHTDFIRRRAYKAGARSSAERREVQRVFYENMRRNHYTVCVRGQGNYSIRLFETMAMGRIPILVDTDCLLPHDRFIDWRRSICFVDATDLSTVDAALVRFHRQAGDIEALQRRCRRLWEEFLTLKQFFLRAWQCQSRSRQPHIRTVTTCAYSE
jgi:hypothetical protein